MTMNAQGKAQKRPRNILSLHVRLLLGIETAYKNNNKTKQKTPQQTLGKGENLITSVTTFLGFKCPMLNKKITKHTNKQESVVH